MSSPVGLTMPEMMLAGLAGLQRAVENLWEGRQDAHGLKKGDGWAEHLDGAIGEYVVAKTLNVHWTGKGIFRGDDVGRGQVRMARMAEGSLILHKSDPGNKPFILVVRLGNMRYQVMGWLYADEGKLDHFWRDPTREQRAAYFVPQAELRKDLSALRRLVVEGQTP